MAFLTDQIPATGVNLTDLFHIVNPFDISQGNPAGSSYRACFQQVLSSLTGGTSVMIVGPGICSVERCGNGNESNGNYSTVSGGITNTSNGDYSVIGGGDSNLSYGSHSIIGGGYRNSLIGTYSIIGGGGNNTLDGGNSFIGGGSGNIVSGTSSTIGGGESNLSDGDYSFIGGGVLNTSSGIYSFVGGGNFNTSDGNCSFVGGGYYNTSSDYQSTIGGGRYNTSSGDYSFIGGGIGNASEEIGSFIGGGWYNTSSEYYSTIGGGRSNTSSGYYSFVGGGFCNASNGCISTISGGYRNTITTSGSTIGGGLLNNIDVSANNSVISGGKSNFIAQNNSVIGGGFKNTSNGDFTSILGGSGNTVTHNCSSAVGIGITSVSACTFHTNYLALQNTPDTDSSSGEILVRDSVTGVVKKTTIGSIAGNYLPLSGGTMTGGLIANSGLTANTISQTSYIDFTTGTTNPSAFAGRLFFDSGEEALTYYNVINSPVPIAIGQQLYTRVWNNTGVQIDKGKVIMITGTSNNLPSAVLATNNHSLGSPRPIGVAAENIPSGSEGLVINNGILSGITINTFSNGDTLYLSDTVPGEYVSSTSSLFFSARTNEIGYVIQTGTTTGKIYININNEDSNLTLTDIERNILEGNVISTGVYEYTGITQGTGSTINIAQMRGWIVKNTYSFATLPDVINLYYSGGTNIPLTNIATSDSTFILVNSGSTLVQQTTFPTPQQRRENIFLGKVVHPNRSTITSINQTVDFDVSPMAAIRDLWTPLKLINEGILVSANGVNMDINTSAGTLWGNGIGWVTNQLNPDSVSISGTSPTTFQYRTRLGVVTGGTITSGNTTTILPGYYDLNGVVTAVGGGSNSSTNQRVYLFPTGLIRIQLGQQVYANLAAAVAGAQTETFVEYSLNRENGILIGIISLDKGASVGNGGLVNTSYAKFNFVSKFGEILGGTGGLSTTTLQQAYNNSVTPEITTDSSLGALSVKNGAGTADNVTNVFEGVNSGGTTTSFVRADGAISASTFSGTSTTMSGTKGTTVLNGSTTTAFLTFSGSNTVGGTGYTDFIRVTNTAAGATTPSKTLRVDSLGSFHIINNAYSSTLFDLTDSGNLTVIGRVKSSINYSQTGGGASVTLGVSASPQTILSVSLTTYGNPVMICAYGDAENSGAGYWCTLQLWRDSTQIGAIVHAEGSAGSENIPFAMTYYDAPVAGTYTYYLKANQVTGGNFKFGESTAPILNAREL